MIARYHLGWYLSYNDTRMSTIQLNTPEKTQKKCASFASKNSMKILAIKRGKCLAKQKEWVKKRKKKQDRKRKRRVKVNFVFCTMYLPDLQTSVQTCWFRNRRQHSVRLILNDEFKEQEFSLAAAHRGRTVANKLRCAWLVFLRAQFHLAFSSVPFNF